MFNPFATILDEESDLEERKAQEGRRSRSNSNAAGPDSFLTSMEEDFTASAHGLSKASFQPQPSYTARLALRASQDAPMHSSSGSGRRDGLSLPVPPQPWDSSRNHHSRRRTSHWHSGHSRTPPPSHSGTPPKQNTPPPPPPPPPPRTHSRSERTTNSLTHGISNAVMTDRNRGSSHMDRSAPDQFMLFPETAPWDHYTGGSNGSGSSSGNGSSSNTLRGRYVNARCLNSPPPSRPPASGTPNTSSPPSGISNAPSSSALNVPSSSASSSRHNSTTPPFFVSLLPPPPVASIHDTPHRSRHGNTASHPQEHRRSSSSNSGLGSNSSSRIGSVSGSLSDPAPLQTVSDSHISSLSLAPMNWTPSNPSAGPDTPLNCSPNLHELLAPPPRAQSSRSSGGGSQQEAELCACLDFPSSRSSSSSGSDRTAGSSAASDLATPIRSEISQRRLEEAAPGMNRGFLNFHPSQSQQPQRAQAPLLQVGQPRFDHGQPRSEQSQPGADLARNVPAVADSILPPPPERMIPTLAWEWDPNALEQCVYDSLVSDVSPPRPRSTSTAAAPSSTPNTNPQSSSTAAAHASRNTSSSSSTRILPPPPRRLARDEIWAELPRVADTQPLPPASRSGMLEWARLQQLLMLRDLRDASNADLLGSSGSDVDEPPSGVDGRDERSERILPPFQPWAHWLEPEPSRSQLGSNSSLFSPNHAPRHQRPHHQSHSQPTSSSPATAATPPTVHCLLPPPPAPHSPFQHMLPPGSTPSSQSGAPWPIISALDSNTNTRNSANIFRNPPMLPTRTNPTHPSLPTPAAPAHSQHPPPNARYPRFGSHSIAHTSSPGATSSSSADQMDISPEPMRPSERETSHPRGASTGNPFRGARAGRQLRIGGLGNMSPYSDLESAILSAISDELSSEAFSLLPFGLQLDDVPSERATEVRAAGPEGSTANAPTYDLLGLRPPRGHGGPLGALLGMPERMDAGQRVRQHRALWEALMHPSDLRAGALFGEEELTYEQLVQLEDVKVTTPADVIDKLPTSTAVGRSTEEGLCSVCQSEYYAGDVLSHLPCKHAFHRDCIRPWLQDYSKKCPICKAAVC